MSTLYRQPAPNETEIAAAHAYLLAKQSAFSSLITGPWGIGKTRFVIKNIFPLAEKNKIKPIYISASGMENAADINKRIFLATYPLLKNGLIGAAGAITGSALDYLSIDIGRLKKISPKTENFLICIDDLERCQSSVAISLFGHFQKFVEQDGCKLIYIANEEKLYEKSKEYLSSKEKFISHCYTYSPDIPKAIDSVINELATKDSYRKLIAAERPWLTKHIHERPNFRSLARVLDDFADVHECLEGHDEKIVIRLLRTYILVGYHLRENPLDTENLMAAQDLPYRMSNEIPPWLAKIANALGEDYMIPAALTKKLAYGFLHPKGLHQDIAQYSSRLKKGGQRSPREILLGFRFFDLPEADFAHEVEALISDIVEGRIEDSSTLISAAHVIFSLMKDDLIDMEIGPDELITKIRSQYEKNQKFLVNHESHFATLNYATTSASMRDLIHLLDSFAERINQEKIILSGKFLVKSVLDGTAIPDDYPKMMTTPFLHLLGTDDIMARITSGDANVANRTAIFLRERYIAISNIRDFLNPELPFVRKMQEECNALRHQKHSKLKRYALSNLTKVLELAGDAILPAHR